MSNFVHFDAPFRFVNLRYEGSLLYELKKIVIHTDKCEKKRQQRCFEPWDGSNQCSEPYRVNEDNAKFVEKVVSTVKQLPFTTDLPTCNISVEALLRRRSDSCQFPQIRHLAIIAQMLYRSHGIEIQQVDDAKSPQNIVVTWHRDNPWLHLVPPFVVISRKKGLYTDCTLKFGERLFPVHRLVLAAKSPYFEKLFNSKYQEAELGAIIPVIMDEVEEKSVEMLLDYFYTGELDLKGASITRIANLVNLSSHFDLPYLAQLCFEHLCKNVNADNLKEYITLARHHNHKELESALARHMEQEVTAGNFAELI